MTNVTETLTQFEEIPSIYQQAIYEFVANPEGGSAVIIGVAGCGKTFTILRSLHFIPKDQTAKVLAYNTAIAKTLSDKIPPELRGRCSAQTFHSAGYRALCKYFNLRRLETNDRKLYGLCKELVDHKSFVPRKYESFACKLVSLAKGDYLRLEDDVERWEDLIDHHGLELDTEEGSIEEALRYTRKLFRKSIEVAETQFSIDFDDQLYLPVLWDLPLEQSDWVFIDEAQDTSPIRRELARKLLKPDGRLIAVGDPKQSIYGFTGASLDALDQIASSWKITYLPLSVCYRCPVKVIELAQTLVPYLEAAPEAPEGRVGHDLPSAGVLTLSPADVVLCRNNAPLVELAYWCLARGIACQILGRDIGKNLQGLIDKLKANSLEELETKLDTYRRREMAKYLAREQHSKAQSIEDRVSCVTTIVDHLPEEDQSILGLQRALDRLFGDKTQGLTLSTIHKAKGKEWPTVAILRPELLPSFWVKKHWEQEQEENLRYVAYTRAMETLLLLDDYDPEAQHRIDQPLRGRNW